MTQHNARSPHLIHLTVLALLALTVRSEAFTSVRRPGSVFNIRGGSEAALQQHGKSQSVSTSLTATINGSNTNINGKSSKMPRSMPPVGIHHNGMKPDTIVPAEYVAETKLPTDIGQFQLRAYRVAGLPVGTEPCVIYARDKPPFGVGTGEDGTDTLNEHVPVRIHDQCLTSEVFRSQRYVLYCLCCHVLCYTASLSTCRVVVSSVT
jgi:hypothetical protein